MSSYVILIKYDHNGAHLDSCLDVSHVTRYGSAKKAIIVETARVKFGAEPNQAITDLAHQLYMLDLRVRFDNACDGPYLIHTPSELTREQIECLLKDKTMLKHIRSARIR